MIVGLDRIRIGSADLTAAADVTERLLGKTTVASEEDAFVQLGNTALQLVPSDDGAEGLAGIAFQIAEADAAFRACERRALKPSPPVAFAEAAGGAMREGRHINLGLEATFGVPTTLIAYAKTASDIPRAEAIAAGAVTGLDHVVIRTTHPNRAAALYGARLGLDMRLDRIEPKWGARLMFFRCGDLIVEVVHSLSEEPSDAPDMLWGLSWRVANAEAAHARLKANGFDVSEIRTGRKPGTRVFTVRNNTLGVPTLLVQPAR